MDHLEQPYGMIVARVVSEIRLCCVCNYKDGIKKQKNKNFAVLSERDCCTQMCSDTITSVLFQLLGFVILPLIYGK